MPAPVVVMDLEFLAQTSLYCVETNRQRVAYFAGLVTGLSIAMEYSAAKITNPNPRLWSLLDGRQSPTPTGIEFVELLRKFTGPNFVFGIRQLKEPGLRYGEPGRYYSQGMSDAVKVAILQVPVLYRYLKGDEWQEYTTDWIEDRIRWGESMAVLAMLSR